ncbi:TPA: hypothetical protein DDW35_05955 [Candidatus Sumerlaeota bacterium]|jgi:polysaccharide biosynthesis/export protein|nr:hypothetical protein [Candidatus Sumerlaeota bacterium]
MKSLFIYPLFLLLLTLTACRSTMPHVPFEARNHDEYPGTPGPGESEYRIGVGDQIKLTVRRYEEFSSPLTVDKMGRIRLPLVLDTVEVRGKTIPQAEAEIGQMLKPYLTGEPRIRIDLVKPNSRFVYVLGAVVKPGKYPLQDERLYVREAVVRAGWPIRGEAALKRVKLVSSSADYNATRPVRLDKILYGGDLTENYEIKEGDIVWVPYTYMAEFNLQARMFLQPIAALIGIDLATNQLGYAPRLLRERDNGTSSLQYDKGADSTQ